MPAITTIENNATFVPRIVNLTMFCEKTLKLWNWTISIFASSPDFQQYQTGASALARAKHYAS